MNAKINTWVKSETHSLAPKYVCGQKRLASLPQNPSVYMLAQSTAICAITFSVFLSRVIRVSAYIRYDGILPNETAETPSHKSAGPKVIYLFVKRNRSTVVDGSYEASLHILLAYVNLEIALGRMRTIIYIVRKRIQNKIFKITRAHKLFSSLSMILNM